MPRNVGENVSEVVIPIQDNIADPSLNFYNIFEYFNLIKKYLTR